MLARVAAQIFVLLIASAAVAQSARHTSIDPADLVKISDKDTDKEVKRSINDKYHGKTVRFTGYAHAVLMSAVAGDAVIVEADGKVKGEAMVFSASPADFKKLKGAIENAGKSHVLVVVEGKAEFPGPLHMPAVTQAKLVSLKSVPKKQ